MTLTYRDRGSSGTQLEAVSGDLAIGSIRKNVLSAAAGAGVSWSWTLYCSSHPACPLPGFRQHGSGSSIDEAKKDLEANWSRWLKAARLKDASVWGEE